MTATMPSYGEQLAFMQEQAAFLRRQTVTLVEAQRMTEAEAQRKRALVDAVVSTITAAMVARLPPSLPQALAGPNSARPRGFVRITCGEFVREHVIPSADMLIDQPSLSLKAAEFLRTDLLHVVAAEIDRRKRERAWP